MFALQKLALIGFLSLGLFAHEVKVTKEFEQMLDPDRMSISFELFAKEQDGAAIRNIFEPLVLKIKKHPFCGGGTYRVEPDYRYETGSRVLMGYSGYLNFGCKFKKTDEIGDLITEIEKEKRVESRQNPIKWVVDEKNREIAKTNLEMVALKYAKKYVGMLKKESIGRCEIKKISVSSSNELVRDGMLKASRSNIQEPKKEQVELSVKANYSFKCE